MLSESEIKFFNDFLWNRSKGKGWPRNVPVSGLRVSDIEDVWLTSPSEEPSIHLKLKDGREYEVPLEQMSVEDARVVGGFIFSK